MTLFNVVMADKPASPPSPTLAALLAATGCRSINAATPQVWFLKDRAAVEQIKNALGR